MKAPPCGGKGHVDVEESRCALAVGSSSHKQQHTIPYAATQAQPCWHRPPHPQPRQSPIIRSSTHTASKAELCVPRAHNVNGSHQNIQRQGLRHRWHTRVGRPAVQHRHDAPLHTTSGHGGIGLGWGFGRELSAPSVGESASGCSCAGKDSGTAGRQQVGKHIAAHQAQAHEQQRSDLLPIVALETWKERDTQCAEACRAAGSSRVGGTGRDRR